ncbi:MAG: hypothetical protein QNJ84_04640 [Alphaproteobacteria bacterium]|nr:hypothetical protein [Alphaproteobacteria bacterium]
MTLRLLGFLAALFAAAPVALVPERVAAQDGQGQQAEGPAFLAGFEDVPLMAGLTVDPDAVLVFDSPAGRIAEAYAVGPVSWDAFATFYTTALTQLGWAPSAAGAPGQSLSFTREGEGLTLDRFGANGALTVRFTLAPRTQ